MDGLGPRFRPDAAGVLRHPREPRGQLDLARVQLGRDAPDQRRAPAPTQASPRARYQYVVTAVYATWTAAEPGERERDGRRRPAAVRRLAGHGRPVAYEDDQRPPLDGHLQLERRPASTRADFTIANTGLGGTPAITSVTGSNTTYTVTASSGTGSGTLGINLVDNGSIVDAYNQPLGDSSGGPNGNFTGQTYTVDRTAPTNSLSLVSQSGGGSYLTGTTVFYQGTGSGSGGSFVIETASPTPAARAARRAPRPRSAARRPAGRTRRAPTRRPPGGPFDSNTFTWNEGTTSAPTEAITSADAAGNNSAATTLTFKNDVTAPRQRRPEGEQRLGDAGRLDELQRDRRLHDRDAHRLRRDGVVDGVRARLERAHGPVGDGEQRHLRQLRLADDAGRHARRSPASRPAVTCSRSQAPTTSATTPSVSTTVIVDTTPPATPTLAFTNLNNAYYNSSLGTLFFRKAAGGTYIVTASSSDPDTPLAAGNAGVHLQPGHRQRLHGSADRRPGLLHLHHHGRPSRRQPAP